MPDRALDRSGLLLLRQHRFEFDHCRIAARCELGFRVPDIGDSTRHARSEIAPSLPQNHHCAAGHVFTTMIARTLYDGCGARIPNREPLASDPTEVGLALDRSVQHRIAHDDVLGRCPPKIARRSHDHATTRQSLTDIVVGLADQVHRHAPGQECAKALTRSPIQLNMNRVIR